MDRKKVSDELGDGISAPKSGPRAHTRRRMKRKPLEKSGTWRRVDGYFLAGFPLTCRSVSCVSESEVSDWRRAVGKSHRRWQWWRVPEGD